jgi:hypothetical protein
MTRIEKSSLPSRKGLRVEKINKKVIFLLFITILILFLALFPFKMKSSIIEDIPQTEEIPVTEVVEIQPEIKAAAAENKPIVTTYLPIAHYKYISSKFTAYHKGVDLVAKKGTKVLA